MSQQDGIHENVNSSSSPCGVYTTHADGSVQEASASMVDMDFMDLVRARSNAPTPATATPNPTNEMATIDGSVDDGPWTVDNGSVVVSTARTSSMSIIIVVTVRIAMCIGNNYVRGQVW